MGTWQVIYAFMFGVIVGALLKRKHSGTWLVLVFLLIGCSTSKNTTADIDVALEQITLRHQLAVNEASRLIRDRYRAVDHGWDTAEIDEKLRNNAELRKFYREQMADEVRKVMNAR